jgi:mono/diheme cytochrome c family protein
MRRTFVWLTVLIAIVCAAVWMVSRGWGLSALRDPIPGEAVLARAAWRHLVPRDVAAATNPVPDAPDVLREGLEHWVDHCATCHSNDGSGDATIGQRIFPRSPDMRLPRTQELADGELFYAIERGVPWTAMPGWSTGTAEGERSSWVLVRFVRHLPRLTDAERAEMERLTPRSPVDDQRDKEIDDFLKGGKS